MEMGSKNHEVVPTPLIAQISGLRGGSGVHKCISTLAKVNLIAKVQNAKCTCSPPILPGSARLETTPLTFANRKRRRLPPHLRRARLSRPTHAPQAPRPLLRRQPDRGRQRIRHLRCRRRQRHPARPEDPPARPHLLPHRQGQPRLPTQPRLR